MEGNSNPAAVKFICCSAVPGCCQAAKTRMVRSPKYKSGLVHAMLAMALSPSPDKELRVTSPDKESFLSAVSGLRFCGSIHSFIHLFFRRENRPLKNFPKSRKYSQTLSVFC